MSHAFIRVPILNIGTLILNIHNYFLSLRIDNNLSFSDLSHCYTNFVILAVILAHTLVILAKAEIQFYWNDQYAHILLIYFMDSRLRGNDSSFLIIFSNLITFVQ
jgi:hypothetical protein